jgi:hypothetical protein
VKFFHAIAGPVVVTAAVAMMTLAGPSAAHAAASPAAKVVTVAAADDCQDGYLCLSQDHGGVGQTLVIPPGYDVANLGDYGFNDNVSSVRNRTGQQACTYSDIDYQGYGIYVRPGQASDLVNTLDDTMSSIKFC